MRLFLASVFTLLLLSGFLASILLSFLFIEGALSIYTLLGLTILVNFILWLAGPRISDWTYRYFYKLQWITIEDLKQKSPGLLRIS